MSDANGSVRDRSAQFRELGKEAIKQAQQLLGAVEEMRQHPMGKHISAQVEDCVLQAMRTIRWAKPACVCPACGGAGCMEWCLDTGVVSQFQWEHTLPDSFKREASTL